MRIAALDIGTNSVHMIIAEINPYGQYEIVAGGKEMVRLGSGGLKDNLLKPDACQRAINAMKRLKKLALSKNVDDIVAVATSAVREAHNGGDFLMQVHAALGLRVQIIHGKEEARLIHLAVVNALPASSARTLIIDIGGGSVELILTKGQDALLLESVKLGVARLKELFFAQEKFNADNVKAMRMHVREVLNPLMQVIQKLGGFQRVVGTSGTILNLCAMAHVRRAGIKSKNRHSLSLSAPEIEFLAQTLLILPKKLRLKLPEYDKKRGELIVVGALLLDEIFRSLKITELTSCDRALREGLILDYIRKHHSQISIAKEEPDIRKRSIKSLMTRYGAEEGHVLHVATLALKIFDSLKALHKLGKGDREILRYGAYLHDIGYHISAEAHHKHTYYLLTQSRMSGFTPMEQQFIALLGRYHSKTKPRGDHPEFIALSDRDRRRLSILAGILKIADALDRSHAGVVKSLVIRVERKKVTLKLVSQDDVELELWAAKLNAELLSDTLGRLFEFTRLKKVASR